MKLAILTMFFVMLAGSAFAQEKFEDVPHKDLVEAVNAKKVVLLDCNNTLTYNRNHIPGALNYGKIKNDLAKSLPTDKGTFIVAYCGDPDCSAYKGGANAALELGYTNVKFYSLGIKGWLDANEKIEGSAGK